MDVVTVVATFLQGQLVLSLISLAAAVAVDLVLGVAVAGIITKDFSVKKLADFWVTTLGYQKLIAFASAVVVALIKGTDVTQGVLAAMAISFAVAILPDIYDKLSTLLFKGALPLSVNLALPAATTSTTNTAISTSATSTS